jgi:hypothetical protein
MLKHLLPAVALAIAPGVAAAQPACVAPVAPAASERPARPQAPPVPICAKTQNCGEGVAADYNRRVNAFNAQAKGFEKETQAYVAKLNAFVAAAEAYAKCEVAALNAGT